MSVLHSLSCNWTWFPSRNTASSDSSKARWWCLLERAVNPCCNCAKQTAGLVVSVKKKNAAEKHLSPGDILYVCMYFGAACAMKAYIFVVVCVWVQSEWGDCVHVTLLCALVYGCVCMLMLMLFVCVVGVPFLAIHRQFVRPAVEARPKARGTAGAPPWLINVAARTSSPPEWRQRPHNAQPVCYACLSLSVDCGLAPVLSWGSRGAKREVRTQTNYHFMTKWFFCCHYIIDLPFRGRSLWSVFGKMGLKGFGFMCTCSQCFKGGHNTYSMSTNINTTIRELQMRRNDIIYACLKDKYPQQKS